jgi:NAD(P)-dependent dehydrogenase (short-subunit alcohol dehydrogenase family)
LVGGVRFGGDCGGVLAASRRNGDQLRRIRAASHTGGGRFQREDEAMAGNLDGRVAVVTGGASGIGEACARLFAARGARVVVADLNKSRAETVAGEIGGHAFEVDVTSAEAQETLAEEVEAGIGPAAIVVTSAGVGQRPLPPEELRLSTYDRMIEIDLKGTYLTCLAFGRRMALRGHGAIVTIASITGMRSTPLHSYGPAKAAVISLTQGLAAEWGRSGVRVNAISPGYTLTPLLKDSIDKGLRDPALLSGNAALGRMVLPDEIARAAAFLASDEAEAITGINLPVDCGWLVTGSWDAYGGLRAKREAPPGE